MLVVRLTSRTGVFVSRLMSVSQTGKRRILGNETWQIVVLFPRCRNEQIFTLCHYKIRAERTRSRVKSCEMRKRVAHSQNVNEAGRSFPLSLCCKCVCCRQPGGCILHTPDAHTCGNVRVPPLLNSVPSLHRLPCRFSSTSTHGSLLPSTWWRF